MPSWAAGFPAQRFRVADDEGLAVAKRVEVCGLELAAYQISLRHTVCRSPDAAGFPRRWIGVIGIDSDLAQKPCQACGAKSLSASDVDNAVHPRFSEPSPDGGQLGFASAEQLRDQGALNTAGERHAGK